MSSFVPPRPSKFALVATICITACGISWLSVSSGQQGPEEPKAASPPLYVVGTTYLLKAEAMGTIIGEDGEPETTLVSYWARGSVMRTDKGKLILQMHEGDIRYAGVQKGRVTPTEAFVKKAREALGRATIDLEDPEPRVTAEQTPFERGVTGMLGDFALVWTAPISPDANTPGKVTSLKVPEKGSFSENENPVELQWSFSSEKVPRPLFDDGADGRSDELVSKHVSVGTNRQSFKVRTVYVLPDGQLLGAVIRSQWDRYATSRRPALHTVGTWTVWQEVEKAE